MSIANSQVGPGPLAFESDEGELLKTLPKGFDRETAKVWDPLQVGAHKLHHRVIHAALGRQRSTYGVESPLAVKYFAQRTVPGTLIVSQATGVGPEEFAWPFSSGLWNNAQSASLKRTISSVHEKGGIWFQQLTHVGRCTSPALVKRAWYNAGYDELPPYGYHPVSSSAVGESGLNTHSGEPFGIPRALELKEIEDLVKQFKAAAQRAVNAGADGIEVLSGNGFLLDQFLHDNINKRTDRYGGSVENRARFTLEIVDAVAEVVGYQSMGVRLSPFSNFHETDGSQPLVQILYLGRELVKRGIAYLSVGGPYSSRNLGIQANLDRLTAKGINRDDLSLKPFRRLVDENRPENPAFTPTRIFGNGGYTSVTTILSIEDGEVDAVVHGKNWISNPDLVNRIREGYPLAEPDKPTFYTHGARGYLTYPTYDAELAAQSKTEVKVTHDTIGESNLNTNGINSYTSVNSISSSTKTVVLNNIDGDSKSENTNLPNNNSNKVAIIGAGISGITSASAFRRLGGFELTIFERKAVPGGAWAYDPIPKIVPKFPSATPDVLDPPHPRPKTNLPATLPRSTMHRPGLYSPLYNKLTGNIPTTVMNGDTVFKMPIPPADTAPYLARENISAVIGQKAHEYDDIISYHTTVEDVEKLEDGKLRLLLRRENQDETDFWWEEDFDFLLVAGGHNAIPKVPYIDGLGLWKGELRHSTTYRNGEELKDKRVLIVGSSESAIDITLQGLPFAKGPIYVSQRTPHPRYPTVFDRNGVCVVTTIKRFTEDSIVLNNNQTLSLTDVDTVIFTTGYFYSYPFLNRVREAGNGLYVPGTYQHVFDIHNPNIAFNGLSNVTLSWLTWEKSAFVVALLWRGLIHLPDIEEQKRWELTRLTEKKGRKFHAMDAPAERFLYFDDLNELAGEYLAREDADDTLLRSFPFEWTQILANGGAAKKKAYGIVDFDRKGA